MKTKQEVIKEWSDPEVKQITWNGHIIEAIGYGYIGAYSVDYCGAPDSGYDTFRGKGIEECLEWIEEEVSEMIQVCSHCGSEINHNTYSCGNGWDGLSKCQGCGAVEGDTEMMAANE